MHATLRVDVDDVGEVGAQLPDQALVLFLHAKPGFALVEVSLAASEF
jgi:hypothetical protein